MPKRNITLRIHQSGFLTDSDTVQASLVNPNESADRLSHKLAQLCQPAGFLASQHSGITLYRITMDCILLYCKVLYGIVMDCLVSCCNVFYCNVLFWIVKALYCFVMHCIVLYVIICIVLHHLGNHCALYMFAIKPHIYVALTLKILFCNALYLIVLYCITLYCIEWIISRPTSNHSTLYSVDSQQKFI